MNLYKSFSSQQILFFQLERQKDTLGGRNVIRVLKKTLFDMLYKLPGCLL